MMKDRLWRIVNGLPEDESEYGSVIERITIDIEPSPEFVVRLDGRLRTLARRDAAVDAGYPVRRSLRLAVGGVVGTLLITLAAALAGYWMSRQAPAVPAVVSADVVSVAVADIFQLESVKYELEGAIYGDSCAYFWGAALTPEEQAELSSDGATPSPTGIVVMCPLPEPETWREEGVYDFERESYRSSWQQLTSGLSAGSGDIAERMPNRRADQIYISGVIYRRVDNSDWQIVSTHGQWRPFSLIEPLIMRVPLSDLNLLRADYDSAERLPDTMLDGVAVMHYRAISESNQSGITRVAEIWVGAEDDFLRKARFQTFEPLDPDFDPVAEVQSLLEDPTSRFYEHRDLPIVHRGPTPPVKSATYIYTFSEPNQPANIEAPVVGLD